MSAVDPVLSARGSLGAMSRWARPGEHERASEAGRLGQRERFRKQVDPDFELPEGEREVAIDRAIAAHAARMRLGRAKARRARGDAA